jgi:hypothetical protein
VEGPTGGEGEWGWREATQGARFQMTPPVPPPPLALLPCEAPDLFSLPRGGCRCEALAEAPGVVVAPGPVKMALLRWPC